MTRFVGVHIVAASALVLASLIGACGASPVGRQIDGQWVDEPYPCPPEGALSCEHLARCATKILWPEGAPAVDSYRVYSPPSRLQDDTLIVRGGWSVIVVFQPLEGEPRAVPVRETDDC